MTRVLFAALLTIVLPCTTARGGAKQDREQKERSESLTFRRLVERGGTFRGPHAPRSHPEQVALHSRADGLQIGHRLEGRVERH